MKFKDILAVTGKPGLYEMITPRGDGLIVRQIGDSKKFFISSRKFMFNPLDNIGIYLTNGDTIPLREVMTNVHNSPDRPSVKDSADELKAWFHTVAEDFDEDQVYVSDIKKVLKWYAEMQTQKITSLLDEDTSNSDEEE